MQNDFSSRHVVVTGGTGALGTAVVGQLLEQGATCHVPCFVQEELARFPHATHKLVSVATGVNLTDEGSVQGFYSRFGAGTPLWGSIHIAGGFSFGPIETVSKGDFTKQWETNALTAFLCCRESVKKMRESRQGGRVVNVSARPGIAPQNGAMMVAYTASKAAVAAITIALAEEVASEGIWVNAVAPSIMDTPKNREDMPQADFSKWPKVDEVARTICFLASPLNQTTRGGIIPVFGRS